MKVKQLIPTDSNGLLRNISELLQQARDKNLKAVFIAYTRKSDGGTLSYTHKPTEADFNLLLDIAKHDLLVGVCEGEEITHYEDDEEDKS